MECCLKQSIMWESTLSKKLRKERRLRTMEWPLVLNSLPYPPTSPTLSSSFFPLPSRPLGLRAHALSLIGMQVPENLALRSLWLWQEQFHQSSRDEARSIHWWNGLQSKREVKCWIHKMQMSCEQLFHGEGSRRCWAEMLYKYVRVNSTYDCADFSKRRAQLEWTREDKDRWGIVK